MVVVVVGLHSHLREHLRLEVILAAGRNEHVLEARNMGALEP